MTASKGPKHPKHVVALNMDEQLRTMPRVGWEGSANTSKPPPATDVYTVTEHVHNKQGVSGLEAVAMI